MLVNTAKASVAAVSSKQADIGFFAIDPERAKARRGGISAFLVPTSTDGFRLDRVIGMWGEPGGSEAESVFDGVWVEPWQLVGELHEGFQIGMLGVSLGRIYNTARSVGLSRWAIELAVEYAKHRQAFGHPISEYQGVTFPLAEAATDRVNGSARGGTIRRTITVR